MRLAELPTCLLSYRTMKLMGHLCPDDIATLISPIVKMFVLSVFSQRNGKLVTE